MDRRVGRSRRAGKFADRYHRLTEELDELKQGFGKVRSDRREVAWAWQVEVWKRTHGVVNRDQIVDYVLRLYLDTNGDFWWEDERGDAEPLTVTDVVGRGQTFVANVLEAMGRNLAANGLEPGR